MNIKPVLFYSLLPCLVACDNNSDDPSTDNELPPSTYQFSMSMDSMNLCGKRSEYLHYEAIVYADNGEVSSRHLPNSNGEIVATIEQTHINLMIVRDTGVDTSDKNNLNITVLEHFPVGDLGTLTTRLDDTEGCICQTANISVIPGRLTTRKMNLPYSSVSGTTEYSQFNNVQLCEIEGGSEAILVTNYLNRDSGEIFYRTIAEPSQRLLDSSLVVDMDLESELGREITINTSENTSHLITYVTDQIYNYSVPANEGSSSINVLEHDRVAQIDFHASYQMDVIGTSQPVRFWGVHVPLNNETTDIFFNKPMFAPELLTPLINNPALAYDLNSENQRIITGFKRFSRLDNTTDEWDYLLPSQRDNGFIYKLPSDYLVGVTEGSVYQDLATYSTWQLTEIPNLSSFDEFYQSEWLKVILPTLSPVMIKPPATYSYVAIDISSPE
ncbi:MAG: hypothetical protein ACSHW0_15930 [Thalassotalea sp.]